MENSEILSFLKSSVKMKVVKKNSTFHLNNAFAYMVQNGYLKVVEFSNDEEWIKYILCPGDFFGGLSLLMGGITYPQEMAVPLTECTIYSVPVELLKEEMTKNPDILQYVYRLIGERILKLENRIGQITFMSSSMRVYDFIKNFAVRNGKKSGTKYIVEDIFTHNNIAQITGSSRQTVTTTINQLKNSGIVAYNKNLIVFDSSKPPIL